MGGGNGSAHDQLTGVPVLGVRTARRARRAFTLVEVILVVAIMAILATIMVPQFIGAMKEHRLRSATRTIVSAGRHAMSLAVISQREILLDFDLGTSTITVHAAPVYRPEDAVANADGKNDEDDAEETWRPNWETDAGTDPEGDRPEAQQALLEEDVVRKLQDVRIESVNLDEVGYEAPREGAVTVRYFTNGRCTPYTVRLLDEDGAQAVIEVDALSGVEVRRM